MKKSKKSSGSKDSKKGKSSKKAKSMMKNVVAGMRLPPGMKVSADGYVYMDENFKEKRGKNDEDDVENDGLK